MPLITASRIFFAAVFLTSFSPAALADVAIDCPAFDAETSMSLSFANGVLSVKNDQGIAALPATLDAGQSGVFTVTGQGPMTVLLPDQAAFDLCLQSKLKEHDSTAADQDMLGYVENVCRLQLSATAVPTPVNATVTVVGTDPKIAIVSTMATYPKPSAVTGLPMALGNPLPRSCIVTSGP